MCFGQINNLAMVKDNVNLTLPFPPLTNLA